MDDLEGLSEDWTACSPDMAARTAAELRREMPRDHALADRRLVVVARYLPADGIIVHMPDHNEWAVIHLTWPVETDRECSQ